MSVPVLCSSTQSLLLPSSSFSACLLAVISSEMTTWQGGEWQGGERQGGERAA